MSYVGNTPTTQGFSPAIDYFNGTGSQTAFTLSRPIASVAQVVVVVNNVTQNPSSAYTVSGNTITFTGAPSSGTSNIYVSYTSPITQVQALTQSPSVIGPMYVSLAGGTTIGGATNPILGLSGAANNYVQGYVNNTTNGVNSSADLVAYPSNGTDASGWVDMGITSPTYSQAAFSVTGPNEAYVFGSAPSGSGTTGNLVIATDSTGTANAIQFYTNGFNKAKGAYAAQIDLNSNFAFNSGYGSAATAYGCRAWVNFNGTGTVAIRSSGNVSSITDNGTGTYTVNFTTAMPDANYSYAASATTYTGNWVSSINLPTGVTPATSSLQLVALEAQAGGTLYDPATVCVQIFR
jgi:hypothetical protein